MNQFCIECIALLKGESLLYCPNEECKRYGLYTQVYLFEDQVECGYCHVDAQRSTMPRYCTEFEGKCKMEKKS